LSIVDFSINTDSNSLQSLNNNMYATQTLQCLVKEDWVKIKLVPQTYLSNKGWFHSHHIYSGTLLP